MNKIILILSLVSSIALGQSKIIDVDTLRGVKTEKNYILNGDAEIATPKWNAYADAAAAIPVDCTGGSPVVTFTRSSTTPLAGLNSFLYTKDSANRQGNGASYDFTIENKDKAKPIEIDMDWSISSGTFVGSVDPATASDVIVYIYDVTNAVLIEPAGRLLEQAVSGISYKYKGTFQASSTSTSYRLCLHTATTSTAAYTLKMDSIKVGRPVVPNGAVITDWQIYPMTIGATTTAPTKGTTSVDKAYWRRVGDHVEIRYEYKQTAAGASGTGTYLFPLPAGLVMDTAKINTVSGGLADTASTVAGAAQIFDGTTVNIAQVSAYNTTNLNMSFGTSGNTVSASNYPLGNTSARYGFEARVPIVGWSSNVQMSNDTDTRVVSLIAKSSSTTITGSFADIVWATIDKDTHGGLSSAVYTVPVSGIYDIDANLGITGTYILNTLNEIDVYKNNSTEVAYNYVYAGGAQTSIPLAIRKRLDLVAGDTIRIRAKSSATSPAIISNAALNNFSVSRKSGPAQIAASESVSFLANTSTTAATTSAPFIYSTVESNSHGAYSSSTGKFTAPMSGVYHFDAVNYTGASFYLSLYKNGTRVTQGVQATSGSVSTISSNLRLLAGDTVEVRPDSSVSATGGAIINLFSGYLAAKY